jgi:hypothetical protein
MLLLSTEGIAAGRDAMANVPDADLYLGLGKQFRRMSVARFFIE